MKKDIQATGLAEAKDYLLSLEYIHPLSACYPFRPDGDGLLTRIQTASKQKGIFSYWRSLLRHLDPR